MIFLDLILICIFLYFFLTFYFNILICWYISSFLSIHIFISSFMLIHIFCLFIFFVHSRFLFIDIFMFFIFLYLISITIVFLILCISSLLSSFIFLIIGFLELFKIKWQSRLALISMAKNIVWRVWKKLLYSATL